MLKNKFLLITLLYLLSNMGNISIAKSNYTFPLFEWCKSNIDNRIANSVALKKLKIKYIYFSDLGEFKSSIVGVMNVTVNDDGELGKIAIDTLKYLCIPSTSEVEDFSRRGISNILQFLHSKGKNNHVYFDMLNEKIYAQSTPEQK